MHPEDLAFHALYTKIGNVTHVPRGYIKDAVLASAHQCYVTDEEAIEKAIESVIGALKRLGWYRDI